jgi:hypothetical protein
MDKFGFFWDEFQYEGVLLPLSFGAVRSHSKWPFGSFGPCFWPKRSIAHFGQNGKIRSPIVSNPSATKPKDSGFKG